MSEVARKLKDAREGQRFLPLLSSASMFYDEKQKKFQDPPKVDPPYQYGSIG